MEQQTVDINEKLYCVAKHLGKDEMLLQLAEECAELSQACLKMVRASKGLTPKSISECQDHLAEELNDVRVCMELVERLIPKLEQQEQFYKAYKSDRWYRRTFEGQNVM